MSFFLNFHLFSILNGLQSISELSPSERRRFMHQFSMLYRESVEHSNVCLRPEIVKRLCMPGMTSMLIRRLVPKSAHLKRRILTSSCDFSKYARYLHDPSRLIYKTIIDRDCYAPIGCCWDSYRNRLLVTSADSVFGVSIDQVAPANENFQRLFHMPHSNFYGIDVSSRNGQIVIIKYGRNELHLLNSDGSLIGTYVVMPNMQQTVLCSGVCLSHCGQYILCFSNFGIQMVTIGGAFVCTLGGRGAKPGEFRDEGQIIRLSHKNKFAISDIRNNRVQIVEIDFELQNFTVEQIFGNNCFIDPLGIVSLGNCLMVFSHTVYPYIQRTIYLIDSLGKILEFSTVLGEKTRFACMVPDGSIVVINQLHSSVTIIKEDHTKPIAASTRLPNLRRLTF